MRTSAAIGLACALWVMCGASASAFDDPLEAPFALSTFEVSDPEREDASNGFESATNRAGDALVVWIGRGDPDEYYDEGPVFARLLAADGSLEPTQQISPDDGAFVGRGLVGLDASGAGVVVWIRYEAGGRRVVLRRRSSSGDLGPVEDLDETGVPIGVGMDARGIVSVLLMYPRADGDQAYALRRRYPGGITGSRVELASGENEPDWEHLAVSASGRVVTVGLKRGWDSKLVGRAIERDGSVGPITNISPPNPNPGICDAAVDSADVAVNDDGDAYVAWGAHVCEDDRVLGRAWRSDGSFASIDTLAAGMYQATTRHAAEPDATINSAGAAYVSWSGRLGPYSAMAVQGRLRRPDGSLAELDLVRTGGWWPRSTFDDRGQATVAWIDQASNTDSLYARTLVPGGARGRPVNTYTGAWTLGIAPFAISTGAQGNPLLLALNYGGEDYNHFWIEGARLGRWAPTPTSGGDPAVTEQPEQPRVPTSPSPPIATALVGRPPAAKPRVSASLSRRRLVAANTRGQRRVQRSASVVYRLSEGGRVTIAIERLRCRAESCKRSTVSRLRRSHTGGRHRISLNTVARGHALRPGRYRLALRLRNRSGAASRLTAIPFSVVRRPAS